MAISVEDFVAQTGKEFDLPNNAKQIDLSNILFNQELIAQIEDEQQ